MKQCISCPVMLKDDDVFCGTCGEAQNLIKKKQTPITNKVNGKDFIMVLCILTLVGSFFGMFRGLLYQAVAEEANNHSYYRGLIFILANLGTMAGAIVMLIKYKIGLYVFTVFQIVYLITIVLTSLVYIEDESSAIFSFTLAMLFFLPSLAFLIMYWLPQNRLALR